MSEVIKIICSILGGVVTTLIPCIIALVRTIKSRKVAKTEAEKQAAYNDMLNVVNTFIAGAEETYKSVNAVLKQQGGSAGAVKKESVLTKLQGYALEKGYEFNSEAWSEKVDEIVKLTREVNAKN